MCNSLPPAFHPRAPSDEAIRNSVNYTNKASFSVTVNAKKPATGAAPGLSPGLKLRSHSASHRELLKASPASPFIMFLCLYI